MLLQTQDAGGPRGRFTFNASGTGNPAEPASLSGLANPLASFLLDWPNAVQRDLKVIDQPGTQALGGRPRSSRTSGRCGRTSPSTSGCAGSTTRRSRGIEGKGTLANYDPTTNRSQVAGYGNTDERAQREELLQELRAAHRHLRGGSTSRRCVRAGYGVEHDSVPGQPLRVQLPGQAELLGHGGEQLPGAGLDGGRLPGAGRSRTSRPTG